MNIHKASYAVLEAFERSPGSAKRPAESRPMDKELTDFWASQVRDELSSARLACGPEQHNFEQKPTRTCSSLTPTLHSTSTTSRSLETWTHPEKNAYVQVKDERESSEYEGLSSTGATVYHSCAFQTCQRTIYGIETEAYLAGMRIIDRDHSSRATAFQIDKSNPEKSWITEWNIR